MGTPRVGEIKRVTNYELIKRNGKKREEINSKKNPPSLPPTLTKDERNEGKMAKLVIMLN